MVNKFRSLQKAATRRRQPIDLSQIDTVDIFEDCEMPDMQHDRAKLMMRKND